MAKQKQRLIEKGFPFAQLSAIAEQESWRKEINRPPSYIHKWWARRLGSIFRGLIIGGFEDSNGDFFDKYYKHTIYKNKIVFDPFMGSGTTVHEAVKLGAKALGADINPVAVSMVRASLDTYSREDVIATFEQIKSNCSAKIKKYYKAPFREEIVDVLYYFWVKVAICGECGTEVPLTKSCVFSKNAYVSKKPEARALCPHCLHINKVLYSDTNAECKKCKKHFNPQQGNVKGYDYICPVCGKKERIIDYMRRKGSTPREKMYAKMIIDHSGKKHYVDIEESDIHLYKEAQRALPEYQEFIPNDKIHDGINTRQILNYQYRYWREMFNDRQLLSFGILSKEIMSIRDEQLRRLFAVLLSGTLEFNNMFCSFKGEGTGAVRPLFYNHILKNELMPLEANPWGHKASSGYFSTLFETRIKRMLDYKENPFELKILPGKKSEKVFLNGCKDEAKVATEENWDAGNSIILCKDSAHIDIMDESVDLVVTDPPFFDNVNYSELADFFYVWLKMFNIGVGSLDVDSTRGKEDVQDNEPESFSRKLCDVFKECNRVLKQEGRLIFTYHHSRTEGWVSVYNALTNARFSICQVIPLKAEMSVSVAIIAAKEPINYDLVFVCKKQDDFEQMCFPSDVTGQYNDYIEKIKEKCLKFSEGDKLILKYGLSLKYLSELGIQNIGKEDIEKIVITITN